MPHAPLPDNSDFLPVDRLPAELLCKIFQFACIETANPFTISHVCQRWRETAITYSQLWSYVSVSLLDPALYELWMQRSLIAPLDTIVTIPSRYLDKAVAGKIEASLRLLAANGERLRTVEFRLSAGAEYLLENLDVSTPRLERLVCGWADPRDLRRPDPEPLELPTLFKGHTPNLRSLQLFGVRDYVLDHFGDLTSLSLKFGREGGDDGLRFFNLLRRCPLLQFLELEFYFIPPVSGFGPPIQLTALTELKLCGVNSRCILSNIDTPEISTLLILSPRNDVDVDEIASSFALPDDLSGLVILQKLEKAFITSSFIGGIGDGAVRFFLDHDRKIPACLDHLSRAQFSHLTELKISCERITLDRETLLRLFTNMSSLRVLRIERIASSQFLYPLVSSTICPHLETLVVAVTYKVLEVIFELVKAIVTSRAAASGTQLRVGHIVDAAEEKEEGSEHRNVSGEWIQLCEENHIDH